MKMLPEHEAEVRKALAGLTAKATAAQHAPDTDAARRALITVWDAVHDALEAIRRGEAATRDTALAQHERKVA